MILITEPSQGALLSEVTPPLRLPKKKKRKRNLRFRLGTGAGPVSAAGMDRSVGL